MRFFVGLHMPSHAGGFDRCMISVNRLRNRVSTFPAREWLMDCGGFTEVTQHGGYREAPSAYAAHVNRWVAVGQLLAAVSQDYMCEAFALAKTGLSIADHQRLTVERYDALRQCVTSRTHLMPVLQGWTPADYVSHVRQYQDRLTPGMWVGVGSVCKRNVRVGDIEAVLGAIHRERPDLRLHGFGLKSTALTSARVRDLLYSADSMAWSWAARREGRNANDPVEARRFVDRIERQAVQESFVFAEAAA